MAPLPPNQLLHIGPDPSGASWNHYNLGLGLTSHVDYAQSALGSSPPVGQPWFYSRTNPTSGKDVVVFSAPLGGATTSSNTEYSRSELRELQPDGTTKAAWDPKSGDHWIEGIYRIYGLSGLQKPGVVVAQAHDASDDTIQIRTELVSGATKLQIRFNGNLVGTLNSSYVDGTEFYLKLRVNNGTPEVYYTTNLASIPGTPTYTSASYFSAASSGWYWKTGSYNQTNELTDPNVDPDASIIKVEIRELKTWHTGRATPATYATGGSSGGPTVNAGADLAILPSGTFSRTATVTLNGATLTSQEWKILSGPAGAGNILSTAAAVSWIPGNGYTTSGGATQTQGVGGIAAPAPASNVELNTADRGDMNITVSGTALVPRIYDGGGHKCGRLTISADYIIVQNYYVQPNSQYGVYITGSHVTVQNCDISHISVSGDGDLNVFTLLEGSDIKLRYNTAVNPISGDPGGSHTDAIQTWVSSSHPTAVSNVQVIGNKFTGPSNPSRDNSIASIHQCIMVESAGHGGNSGGSGTPSNWLVLDNTFGDSWGQSIKLDSGNNFTFARNNWIGSSDNVFEFDGGSGNVVYSSNIFGSGYGGIGASTTAGNGPADPDAGTGGSTTHSYPNGTYVLQFTAVTSAGTVTDTVTVTISTVADPGAGGGGTGGVVGTYPSLVSIGDVASSDGSGTVVVPAPAGVASGHFQICVIQDAGTESITDVPSGWQLLDDQDVTNADFGAPGGDSSAFIYYNTTGDSADRSWSKSGSRGYQAVRMAWKDWSALGQHFARGSSFTTTPYATAVTPTTDKALVVTVLGSDRSDIGPDPVSVPTGWTSVYNHGETVNVNEIEWISVAALQVDNRTTTGANVPSGTGVGTSNFDLTNADNCSMFSFVLEGIIGSGTTTGAAISLQAQPSLVVNLLPPTVRTQMVASATLLAWSMVQGATNLLASASLNLQAVVFPRGTLVVFSNLLISGAGSNLLQLAGVQLQAIARLWAAALPYRRPVLRTDYKYPPPNHPFRLIAQRILDGEIVEWELPVADDFEYVEQLSGPTVMHGSFHPEIISVQELNLDGYAYWLHVEINQEIRASAIMLPPQYAESALTFSAEGVSATPHYTIYDGVFQQIQVDPLSVVRTIWNYVQAQPQADLGVIVSGLSSPVRLGEPARTETTVTDNGDGTTTTTIKDVPAAPYELVWWNATNCGEEIDKLAGQTPFDYLERHAWNADKTDVLHYFDMGYPRLGVQKPDLLFNEENILEIVPIQEDEDTYASAVLVIGAGEGADTIRGYAAQSFGDRVRKEVVITDKTITDQARANSRAFTELAIRRGRAFEIAEIVIDAYHTNAPIGSYKAGDDIRIEVDIPWLMETHIAWYRITSITTNPSSDKVRIAVSHAGAFDYTEAIIEISPDAYIPFTPPEPAGPNIFPGNVQLIVFPVLSSSGTLIPALIGAVSLTVGKTLSLGGIVLRSGAVSMTVGKTLTAAGIATGAAAGTVTLIVNKTLTAAGVPTQFGAVSLGATATLTASAVTTRPAAVSLAATPTLTAGAGLPGGAVALTSATTLTAGSGATLAGAVNLNAGKTLTVAGTLGAFGAVALTIGKTLSANGTIPTAILPVVRSQNGASGASAGGNAVVTKPTGLAVNDFIIGVSVCDNDGTLGAMTGPAWNLEGSNAPVSGGRPGIKIWSKVATSTETGATNFTFSSGTGVYCSAGVLAIQAGTYNPTTPLSATPVFGGSDSNATGHVAPSVSPGVVNGLLVTVHGTDQGGAASCSYTPPSGMTEKVDTATGSGFTCLEINTVALASTSATGTKSATCTASRPCNCASFIINPG